MDGLACALAGRLAKDGELRYTSSGTALVTVSVAVDDSKAGEGETTWVRVGHFGADSEDLRSRLVKGAQVYVEGRLRLNAWTAADGTPRSGLNCTAWRLEVHGQIGRRRPAPSDATRSPAVVDPLEAA